MSTTKQKMVQNSTSWEVTYTRAHGATAQFKNSRKFIGSGFQQIERRHNLKTLQKYHVSKTPENLLAAVSTTPENLLAALFIKI